MMVLLVIVWGLELAIAKDALEYVDRLLVLNVKYFFGFFVIAAVAKKTTGFHLPALRDLPFVLETPNELPGYAAEIRLLKEMRT